MQFTCRVFHFVINIYLLDQEDEIVAWRPHVNSTSHIVPTEEQRSLAVAAGLIAPVSLVTQLPLGRGGVQSRGLHHHPQRLRRLLHVQQRPLLRVPGRRVRQLQHQEGFSNRSVLFLCGINARLGRAKPGLLNRDLKAS